MKSDRYAYIYKVIESSEQMHHTFVNFGNTYTKW